MTQRPTLLTHLRTTVIPALQKELGKKNALSVPRISKVILNAGIGKFATDTKKVEAVQQSFMRISGQKPVLTKARKSISNFKIRKGLGIGCMVTLRGQRMYDFLEKLIHVALPRVRDFRGLSPAAFDRRGNYTIPIREQNVFPEIRSDDLEFLHGLQITICTTARSQQESHALLRALGFPIQTQHESTTHGHRRTSR
jgi:large subunit ribosomal protein L5